MFQKKKKKEEVIYLYKITANNLKIKEILIYIQHYINIYIYIYNMVF